jgi:hypothetical protein
MTDKHEVTVYDRVPATARVSVEDVDAYMRQVGWVVGCKNDDGVKFWDRGNERLSTRSEPEWLAHDIMAIAAHERRVASVVLADIAAEPA